MAIYDKTTGAATLVQWNLWVADNFGKIKADGSKFIYLKDHLGSIRAIVDGDNALVYAKDYDMWGYPLEGRSWQQDESKYKFTSKERDIENSYDYFGARYYDARIGRWGGVEPKYDKNICWTPYIYSSDNPVNKMDYNGLDDYYFHSKYEVEVYHKNPNENYYYVQCDQGKIEYNGEQYIQANSYETATLYDWKTVDMNFGAEKFVEAFTDAKPPQSNDPIDILLGILGVDKYEWAGTQSIGGKMDQKEHILKDETILSVLNNIAYNKNEAGNIVWGAVMSYMGFSKEKALKWANDASLVVNKRPDESWEQTAIGRGVDFYQENKNNLK